MYTVISETRRETKAPASEPGRSKCSPGGNEGDVRGSGGGMRGRTEAGGFEAQGGMPLLQPTPFLPIPIPRPSKQMQPFQKCYGVNMTFYRLR